MCLEEGGVLEVVLPSRGQMTYLGEVWVCLGAWNVRGIIQVNYKMNFIQDSFQDFPSTSDRLLSLQFCLLYYIKNAYF